MSSNLKLMLFLAAYADGSFWIAAVLSWSFLWSADFEIKTERENKK